jgi:hypothetical protein
MKNLILLTLLISLISCSDDIPSNQIVSDTITLGLNSKFKRSPKYKVVKLHKLNGIAEGENVYKVDYKAMVIVVQEGITYSLGGFEKILKVGEKFTLNAYIKFTKTENGWLYTDAIGRTKPRFVERSNFRIRDFSRFSE